MSAPAQLIVFRLEGQCFALPLGCVERVVRAVEVTPLPGAPPVVVGVIDVAGCVVPVLCLRQRLGLRRREIAPSDQLLIARMGRRTVALPIDEAQGVIECDASTVIDPQCIVPGLEQFQGLAPLDDGLVLVHDLERFLSLDETHALDKSMDPAA
ncbi:MAG: chemotaxis protein CheW [Burkholderiales bacterium]|nr:chemotaxis protein CheW [Burkholderiales bacterium]